MEVSINDLYIKDILFECGFDDKYPYSQLGILTWLRAHGITIVIQPIDNKWEWVGADFYGLFSQDFTQYDTFDEVVNSALVESICYLYSKDVR